MCYTQLYAFLTIIIIIIIIIIVVVVVVVVIFQLRQAVIIKRALIGLAYVACAGQIISSQAAPGALAKGREGLLPFSLLVRPRHFFFRSHKKAMSGYDGGSYSETFMRASKY